MEIYKIIDTIRANRIKITDHAYEEAKADRLSFDEIYISVFNGEIIENYPDDEPYPSCLLYGINSKKEPIHSVWAYNSENRWAVLITVYRPDPSKWVDWKHRRK